MLRWWVHYVTYVIYSDFVATIANVGVIAVGLSFSNPQICPQNWSNVGIANIVSQSKLVIGRAAGPFPLLPLLCFGGKFNRGAWGAKWRKKCTVLIKTQRVPTWLSCTLNMQTYNYIHKVPKIGFSGQEILSCSSLRLFHALVTTSTKSTYFTTSTNHLHYLHPFYLHNHHNLHPSHHL